MLRTPNNRRLFAILFLMLAGFFRYAYSMSAGSIRGVVQDAVTKEPMAFATVQVLELSRGTSTDEKGRFEFTELPPGTYRVQASMLGHVTRIKTDVVVAPGHSKELIFQLEPAPLELPGVEIRPRYFEPRTESVTSTQALSNEEIRRAPGGFEDVVRAISVLPGVVQAQPGRNDLIVRGGAPSENLFIVDDVEVPNINHFGTQGATGGPLSFVNLDFVRDVTFSTGGFGAKYGDKLSSVMKLDLAEGRKDRWGGKATLSATQLGLNLEGPLSERGTVLASARRSYLDWIFAASGFAFVPEYWDFLGKGSYTLDSRNRLSVTGIGVLNDVRLFNEDADQRFDNSRILANSQNQYHLLASWQRLFRGGFATTSLGRSSVDYQYLQNDSLLNPIFRSESREDETNLRTDAVIEFRHDSQLNFGAQARLAQLDGSLFLPAYRTSFGDSLAVNRSWNRNGLKSALYAEYRYRFTPRLLGTLGMRGDHFDLIENKFAFGPRFALSYTMNALTTLSLSGGRYHQAPSYVWLVSNSENRRLNHVRADQLVAGVERLVREDTRVRFEGYIKRYGNYPASLSRSYLVLANSGAGWGGSEEGYTFFGFDPLVSEGTGLSRGVELLVQKRLSDIRCYGIASLTYGRTEFKARDGRTRAGAFDQPVIFNLSGGYKPNDVWEYALKFRAGSGLPYTPFNADGSQNPERYNSERLPVTHSLDVRVDRRWNFSSWNLITYLDIQNIYNNRSVGQYRWNPREQRVEKESSIGILPSIGVSAEF